MMQIAWTQLMILSPSKMPLVVHQTLTRECVDGGLAVDSISPFLQHLVQSFLWLCFGNLTLDGMGFLVLR